MLIYDVFWYLPDSIDIMSVMDYFIILNLRALKSSLVNIMHIFQCMGKIFWMEFQRLSLHILKRPNAIWKMESNRRDLSKIANDTHRQLGPWNKIQRNSDQCTKAFIQWNTFGNVSKMLSSLMYQQNWSEIREYGMATSIVFCRCVASSSKML